ncbi:Oidioi.mRNA.OKI2018_I69.chr1.g110.t1.cds [Oikopleura dioica]|uniref:Oidioi.mRNA.OKI2018_I69.chr1.g110.t1.cds n=1 Tax=Oikopleura dioica TaxID=34765 RepID=A0ABN7SKJ8_OIKDI|nr:Oidioi.mRNA.OKI2018_I69.chr1.g110.t1.cds [Oikopleura dioica]
MEGLYLKASRLLRNDEIEFGFHIRSQKTKRGYLTMVSSVDQNSPAESAGLEEGDFIIEINGVSAIGLRNKSIVSLVKMFRYHVIFVTFSCDFLNQIDFNKLDDLPVHHVWKAWSPFGAPRNIRIQLTDDFPFEAFRNQLDSNLRFEESSDGINKGDRIILLNGKRIRSKERLRDKIAEEVDFIATEYDKVIDRGSENVFKDLELDIKEDLAIYMEIPKMSLAADKARKEKKQRSEKDATCQINLKEENGISKNIEKNKELDLLRQEISKLKQEKKKMKIDYEYETGFLKGKNEAIMEHSKMIQNKYSSLHSRLEELQTREHKSKLLLSEMNQALEKTTHDAYSLKPTRPPPRSKSPSTSEHSFVTA